MQEKQIFGGILLMIQLMFISHKGRAQSPDTSYKNNQYKKQLAALAETFEQDGFNLTQLMKDDRFEIYEDIGHRFTHSAERTTPTQDEYKELLHFKEKVESGTKFLEAHRKELSHAQRKYGISKYIITAIIGIESNYGENIGSYNPFNVYVSMIVVDHRADFARAQLKELLEFAHRKELDLFTLKSSYAGAVSYAQFIPYSLNKWFVGKDIFDMTNNINSVANYLAYFKKRTDNLPDAILHYNTSTLYRDFVLDLADAIKEADTD